MASKIITISRQFGSGGHTIGREVANRLGIPLEYNLLGLQKTKKPGTFGYPCQKFWQIAAEENVTAVIGVDAHSPQHLLTFDMEGPRAMLKEMGITVLDDPMTARKR